MRVHGAKLSVVISMHVPSEPAARSKGCGLPSLCTARPKAAVRAPSFSTAMMQGLLVVPGGRVPSQRQ